ncbi:hypothetical protein CMQ_5246 [Grosmannia clavigera kw1407]|uniref:Uncharacterized protein n=1 Tax=Grosmannia clavigera (strain kw1407 / UAMH 11150) TaxID=655863 RepID=F0XB93_GROCL|nr:uncharacterized protein CMQ_5246 [Grosmannia clavigera kw1407]EFX04984.1 hypothetical protein CMQ_5246 [Grosmannia clavigera kw1407]
MEMAGNLGAVKGLGVVEEEPLQASRRLSQHLRSSWPHKRVRKSFGKRDSEHGDLSGVAGCIFVDTSVASAVNLPGT